MQTLDLATQTEC